MDRHLERSDAVVEVNTEFAQKGIVQTESRVFHVCKDHDEWHLDL